MVSVADLERGIDVLADPLGLLSGAASRIEELQAKLADMTEERDKAADGWAATLNDLQWWQRKMARRCETCRHFHANTYICLTECTPLRCVVNDYSEWEARE